MSVVSQSQGGTPPQSTFLSRFTVQAVIDPQKEPEKNDAFGFGENAGGFQGGFLYSKTRRFTAAPKALKMSSMHNGLRLPKEEITSLRKNSYMVQNRKPSEIEEELSS